MYTQHEIVDQAQQLNGFVREMDRVRKVLKNQKKVSKKLESAIIAWMGVQQTKVLRISPELSCRIVEKKTQRGMTSTEKKEKLEEYILAKGSLSWNDYNEHMAKCEHVKKEIITKSIVFESSEAPPRKKIKVM